MCWSSRTRTLALGACSGSGLSATAYNAQKSRACQTSSQQSPQQFRRWVVMRSVSGPLSSRNSQSWYLWSDSPSQAMLVCSLAFITLVIYDQRDSADWAFGCIFFPASHGVRGREESYPLAKAGLPSAGYPVRNFRRRRATPPSRGPQL